MKKLSAHVVSLAIAGAFVLSAPSYAAHPRANSDLGTPVHDGIPERHQSDSVDRVIEIDAGTKHINVVGGQTVRFVVGDRSFDWLFDTYATSPVFDLKDIAPVSIVGDRQIKVYVSPDPLYAS